MRHLVICCLLCTFAFSAYSQNRTLNSFIRQHKKTENAVKISAPGWVIKLGAAVSKTAVKASQEEGDEAEAELLYSALKVAKGIKKVKLLVLEDATIPADDVDQLVRRVKNRHHFEELMSINTDGTKIRFMSRGKGDKIKNLLFLVSDGEDGFVMVSVKSKLRLSEIGDLINKAIKEGMKEEVEKEMDVPRA